MKYDVNNEATFNKGIGWSPISNFNGVLDGKGYTINNMYIYSNVGKGYDENDEKNVGLFAVLDNATIKNLKIKNVQIESEKDVSSVYIGILAGSIKESNLSNIEVLGNINVLDRTSNNIGNAVGLLAGKINNTNQNIDKIACIGKINHGSIRYSGGMFGIVENDSVLNLNNIFINANIKSSIERSIYIGGIVGGGHIDSISNSSVHLSTGKVSNKENYFYIDTLIGNYESSNINKMENLLVSNENYGSITKYNPNADENIRTENVENVTLEELKLDSNIWEYIENNPYPTLKGCPYYFILEIDVPETIYIAETTYNKQISIKVIPENASNNELNYIVPDDQINVIVSDDGIISGRNKGKTTLTIRTMDGSNIIKEVPIEVVGDYNINVYNCDKTNKTISNIFPTTIEHYKENIALEQPYTAKVFKDGEEVTEGNIATGMITKIYIENQVVDEYTNIVPGDIYADGIVNSRDAGMVVQYLVGMLDNLYETPQYYAMDFSRDDKVRLNDVELIKQYVVHIYEPSEEDYYGKNN